MAIGRGVRIDIELAGSRSPLPKNWSMNQSVRVSQYPIVNNIAKAADDCERSRREDAGKMRKQTA